MAGLGYPRFAAHGGDIGAGVTSRLGHGHADSMIGIHLTSVTRPTPYLGPGARELTEAEKTLIREREEWQRAEGGYAHIQGTKPQTLAYGLNDSPTGLAAWIVEKYRTWSDCDGDVERRFTRDELLTTVTIYWVTESISSSTRMYKENQRYDWTMERDEKIEVPTGVAAFPAEISRPRREWAERSYNLQRWTQMASWRTLRRARRTSASRRGNQGVLPPAQNRLDALGRLTPTQGGVSPTSPPPKSNDSPAPAPLNPADSNSASFSSSSTETVAHIGEALLFAPQSHRPPDQRVPAIQALSAYESVHPAAACSVQPDRR